VKTLPASALAIGVAAFITAAMVNAQSSAWIETDRYDPLHQTSFKEFSLQGRFLIPPRQSNLSAPVLMLHCQPGRHDHKGTKSYSSGRFIEGWIATGAVLNSAAGKLGASITVEYRLDGKKLQTDSWEVISDHSGILLNRPFCGDCNLNNLLYGHVLPHKEGTNPQVRRIILGVSEYLAGQIQMQFDLPDSTEVANACGVIEHKR